MTTATSARLLGVEESVGVRMRIDELLSDSSWHVDFGVDPNLGGDGQRIRLRGDSHSFRKLASLLILMADSVDDASHPASESGWHLALNPNDLRQLDVSNAAIVTLDCDISR